MNKSSNSSSLKNIQIDEEWSSHPAIEWLFAHKKILLWALFAFIASLILALRLIALKNLNAETDFFQAQTAFTQFQQAATSSPTATSAATSDLQQLIAMMQRYPEIKPKYEGALAQTLLIEGDVPQAQAFIEDIFNRTQSDHLKLYQDYTQASVLMSKGNYSEALQQAQQLKLNLDQLNEEGNPILYIFNLIRLGMLYQQTHQPEQELKTWEELENQPQRVEAFLAADQILRAGQVSLSQYIEDRKKALKSQ